MVVIDIQCPLVNGHLDLNRHLTLFLYSETLKPPSPNSTLLQTRAAQSQHILENDFVKIQGMALVGKNAVFCF